MAAMRNVLFLFLSGLFFVSATASAQTAPVTPAKGELEIINPWARAMVPRATTSAVYMTLINRSVHDKVLEKAETPVAGLVQIHTSETDASGTMRMRAVPGVVIEGGKGVEFAPGGVHIMLMQVGEPLQEGAEMPLTLIFKDGTKMNVRVPVKPINFQPESMAGDAPPMSDMHDHGHDHHHH